MCEKQRTPCYTSLTMRPHPDHEANGNVRVGHRNKTRRLTQSKSALIIFPLLWCLISAQSNSGARLPQRFAIEPVDRTAIVGDTIILPCRVLNKVGTLQWTKDGFGLGSDRDLIGFPRYSMIGSDEEGDFSLQISNVNLDDDGTFQCQVGAAEGIKGIRSRNSLVTVFVPPEAPKIVEGEYLKTTAGMTVELTCESQAGKPPAELTWLDGDGNPVTSGIEYTTQLLSDGKRANGALKWQFQPTREHDGRVFTCRSENPALKQPQKAPIRMEVKYPPDVKLTIDNNNIVEMDDVRFTCHASANPSEIIYKWYRNEEIVVGDHSTALLLPKVTKDLNGATITCEVTNSVGTTKASHTLNIHFGPVFKTPLENVYAAELGQEVKLTCDVQGNPETEIIWLFEGSPRVLSTEAELIIPEMSYERTGKYVCRASVRGFPEISASTLVFIKGPPRVTSAPVQYGLEGEAIKVECLVQSVPPPTRISWSHNSQSVDVDNDRGFELIEETLPSDSLIRNLLVIHNPRPEDFGAYNCSVWNEFGHDFMVITLAKQTLTDCMQNTALNADPIHVLFCALKESFPMLIIVAAIIGGVVLVVSVTIIVILCMKRKSNLDEDEYVKEIKKGGTTSSSGSSGTKHHHHSLMDTGSSGADSDLKVEIRTSSSMSDQHGQCWDDVNEGSSDRTVTANEIAQVVENIYNYTAEPVFPPTKETQNNNGYIPYVDYSREYLPPPASAQQPQPQPSPQQLHHQHHQHQQHLHQLQQQQQHPQQHASIVVASRDSYVDPHGYGSLTIDPRYRGTYGNPYLRTSSNLTLSSTSGLAGNAGALSGVSVSGVSGVYGTNQRYITSPGSNQQVKPGTLATHV